MAVSDYSDLYEAAGRKYNVDPALLAATATQESNGNPRAVSPVGALGLMQIMPRTAKSLGVDPYDPAQAVDGAARLYADALDRGSLEDAIAEYHGGPDRKLWGPKTRKYREEVLARYQGASGASPAPSSDPSDADVLKWASGDSAPPKATSSADQAPGSDPSDDEVLKLASGEGGAKAATATSGKPGPNDSDLPIGDTGYYATKGQKATYETLVKGNAYDAREAPGSLKNPRYITPDTTESDVADGDYYIDPAGKLQRKGGPEKGGVATGFARGLGDVLQSVAEIAPGTEDSQLRQYLEANQARYDAQHKGDLGAGLGRFTGQVVGTLPAMAATEGVALPILARGGAIGEFLAGKAGQAALPEGAGIASKILNTGAKLGSKAAVGAREGALASALTSSAGEGSVADQAKTGALLGGILAPAGSAVVSGVRRFASPALQGAAPTAEQAARLAMAGELPVPVPMTVGQMTGSPKQQILENAMLKGVSGDVASGIMKGQQEAAQQALRGNVEAIGSQMTGGKALAPGEGAASVSERLNAMSQEAKKGVNAAYDAARASGESAMLPSAKGLRDDMLSTLRQDYDLDRIGTVAKEVERLGEKGAPTVRDLLDARSRLSGLRSSNDGVEAGAAGKAVKALDNHISDALEQDLIVGDKAAVDAWRNALKSRADYGKLFEGKDLIQGLVEQVRHGEGMDNKVDPAEAANYIFGRSSLGFVGKKDLPRDLARLRDVLGPESDEWNALRSEVFGRIARAGEGSPEAGKTQFSGQNFMKAWEKAKRESPQIVNTVFSPQERDLIDKFAEVAQRVTTPVKGGDNPSGTAFAAGVMIKKALDSAGTMVGGGVGSAIGGPGGGALGAGVGRGFDAFMKDIGAVMKARKAVSPVAPKVRDNPNLVTKLLPNPVQTGAVIGGNRLLAPPQKPAVAEPQ